MEKKEEPAIHVGRRRGKGMHPSREKKEGDLSGVDSSCLGIEKNIESITRV